MCGFACRNVVSSLYWRLPIGAHVCHINTTSLCIYSMTETGHTDHEVQNIARTRLHKFTRSTKYVYLCHLPQVIYLGNLLPHYVRACVRACVRAYVYICVHL